MTSQLTIAKVGGGVIDLTGFTGMKGTPYFDQNNSLIELGWRFANGEAHQGTFKVMDPDAELPRADFAYNLPAHKIVTWIEDAPGFDCWLFRGRVISADGGRGVTLSDNFVEFDVTVDDINRDLRFQAFTESWTRPAETDVARLVALQAYTLNGAASTATDHGDDFEITISTSHLCPDTETVTMPAKVYPVGTYAQGVIQDCADASGKVYGVVPHHVGGSHACLLYILEANHSTYASAIKISDNLADWDPTDLTAPVLEPHWEAGKASLYDGQQLLSGLVSIYGTDQSVYVEDTSNITDYGYAVDTYYDSTSTTLEQATAVANGILAKRGLTNITHRVSVVLLPAQVDLVTVGMSLQIKAAAALGGTYLDVYQTRRVAQCTFEPRADGNWWVHLQLDRAKRQFADGAGQAQPASTSPKVGNWSPQDPCVVGVTSDEFTDSGAWDGYVSPLGPTWEETDGSGALIWYPGTAFLPAMPPDPVAPLDHIMELDFGIGGMAFPLDFTVLSSFVAPPDDVITQRLNYLFHVSDDAEVLGFHFAYTGLQADDTVANLNVLVRWGPGAFELSQDTQAVPGVWTQGRRIYTRVLAESQRVRAKAWFEGNEQPDDWLIDLDFTITGESLDDWRFFRARTITPVNELGGDVRLHSICIGDGLTGSTECGTCVPANGDFVAMVPLTYGDGTRLAFSALTSYEPGSLSVEVDGLGQHVTETDPSIGAFTLDFAPNSDELVSASWRAA